MKGFERQVKNLEEKVQSGKANKNAVISIVENLTNQLRNKEKNEGKNKEDIEALMIVLSNIARNLGGARTVYEIQPKILELKERVSNAIQDRNKAVEIGVNLDKRLENQKIQTGAVRSERRRDEINKILENTNLNSTKKNEFLQKYTTGKSRYKTTKQLREELRGVENKNKNDKNKPKTLQNTFKTPFKKKKNAFINYARKTVGSHGGPFQKGRIGKWKNAINRANLESFNKLKTNFDQKLKLHEEIKKTTFVNKGTKQRLQSIVMQQSGRYNNIKKKLLVAFS